MTARLAYLAARYDAPPGLGGANSPHAREVACPDCNDHTGGF